MKNHRKHAKLTRRKTGEIGSFELAILGTKCSLIKELVREVSSRINSNFKVAYADASHDKNLEAPVFDEFVFHSSGNLSSNSDFEKNPYTDKLLFSNYDLVFINGNHYPGNKQILILDPDKEASILKRLDQINDIAFLINLNHNSRIFDFLKDKHQDIEKLKTYSIHDLENISLHVEKLIQQNIAPLHGLVLAGGKSERMGKDKGLLDYFGKSQRLYSIEMLEKLNLKSYMSVRKEQQINQDNLIEDKFIGLGPFGAICSAFQYNPNNAWLVLATDLPYADEKLIRNLIDQRDPSKVATALKGKNKRFPEPLITIWEPRAYPLMLHFMAMGISCPRKVLINSDVKIVEVDDDYIVNVNTPEEFSVVKKSLEK
ncbi:NTP transferase domain-containing protein [Lutimonas zeaxanthinifaciens]|uniref:NTP transferase domain-containing protein n=1 Tax=Lutimonas zeaxanthinifaciens TaxID=3060215 RepID=UPI00265CAD37|nr:NTP transferase domain-containing protein [Lutimonas sp. YSD2104]WKK66148.1 NTP transferase domain-containing protein [Lutimonas sp. YSD2104]